MPRSDKLIIRLKNQTDTSILAIKISPETRNFGGIPARVMRDVTHVYQVSRDMILLRLHNDCWNKFYFTMMHTSGQIIEMEAQLREILKTETQSFIANQATLDGQ